MGIKRLDRVRCDYREAAKRHESFYVDPFGLSGGTVFLFNEQTGRYVRKTFWEKDQLRRYVRTGLFNMSAYSESDGYLPDDIERGMYYYMYQGDVFYVRSNKKAKKYLRR